jgi:hypothetical protein
MAGIRYPAGRVLERMKRGFILVVRLCQIGESVVIVASDFKPERFLPQASISFFGCRLQKATYVTNDGHLKVAKTVVSPALQVDFTISPFEDLHLLLPSLTISRFSLL